MISSSATGNPRSSGHRSTCFGCLRPHQNCWDSLWSLAYSCWCSSAGWANQWPPCTSFWWSLFFGPVLCSCRCMNRTCFMNSLCAWLEFGTSYCTHILHLGLFSVPIRLSISHCYVLVADELRSVEHGEFPDSDCMIFSTMKLTIASALESDHNSSSLLDSETTSAFQNFSTV